MSAIAITQRGSKQSGIIILFSILFLSAILAISISLSAIFTPKIRLFFDVKSSAAALYAADSGIEWCLHAVRKGSSVSPLNNSLGAKISINDKESPVPADCVSPVRSAGTQREVTRSLEASF